ncbi:uncharacterized protein NPIL_569691 [Nephila pilipes]|uniref:Uncharacterized protein n=1 Tax=Nephila pilipes TaxID=299642 RepID=A0A8X6Q004_NEPPI|nr:uncharacterized protein NPIL_569691 [Nephila pilipes]
MVRELPYFSLDFSRISEIGFLMNSLCSHVFISKDEESYSTLDADVSNNEIKVGIKNSCAKEKKVPDSNESFSSFQENIDYHEGTQIATVNTRYVYAMRSIGRCAEAGRMFCALMNLPQPPTRFAQYNKTLLNAVKLVPEETIKKGCAGSYSGK